MNRPGLERRIVLMALFAPLPALVVAIASLWAGNDVTEGQWWLGGWLVATWLGGALMLRKQVAHAFQNISSLLGALRQGDFAVRGRPGMPPDALHDVIVEFNGLAELLASQRTGALEASALLRKVMAEIDVAVFAFDGARKLRLVNRAGEHLLGKTSAQLAGTSARQLDLEALLEGDSSRTADATFVGGHGQWELRRGSFRLGGMPMYWSC
jgi:hypothetical protein